MPLRNIISHKTTNIPTSKSPSNSVLVEKFNRIIHLHYKSSYIPFIQVLLLFETFSRFLPIHYEYSSSKISTWRQNRRHLFAYLTSQFIILLHILVFLEWFYLHPFANVDLWESVVVIYYLLIFSFTLISGFLFGQRSAELRLLIDASIAMETKLMPVSHPVILNTPVVQGVGLLLCIFFPCMPPLIAMRSDLCSSWVEDDLTLLGKIITWLFTAASWSAVIGLTFTSFVITLLYPTLVLFNLYSYVMATPMATLLMGTAMIAEVTILYALIKSETLIPPVVAALFFVIALDFFLIIQIVFKMLRRPYVASMGFKESGASLKIRGKWFNRFMKSCAPVKVPMGDDFRMKAFVKVSRQLLHNCGRSGRVAAFTFLFIVQLCATVS
ncbi:hypothetical protein Fcan01_11873 [Folsomia candida]|uniref:Uncharacterized protein n=1 Tax=Folsomia candida TaxID=158441 RepID=A0A226E9X8_FOLCA|nr:hypothetical protein Fcan01_11873 [Folsomia candida]